jgi:hypothetical protein
MVVNLSLEEQIKAIRIEGQAQVQAEAWLLDPAYKAENVGVMELSNDLASCHNPSSFTLLKIRLHC